LIKCLKLDENQRIIIDLSTSPKSAKILIHRISTGYPRKMWITIEKNVEKIKINPFFW